jgi:haloacetate dehalogenase
MPRDFLREFDSLSVQTKTGSVRVRRGGAGTPVLLLHGFPETHLAWRRVAPVLAEDFTVVAADLPGYGDSVAPDHDGHHEPFSKRAMAQQLVEAMGALGASRFAVIGHDRGARVAYRMALDHPDRVFALGVLDVVPALEVYEHLTYPAARQMVNWFLLAQPAPLPEELIRADPDRYLTHILGSWGGAESIEREVLDEYARCFRNPRVIDAICAEYRAGDSIDLEHDRADRDAGRRISCPVLISWVPGGLVPLFGEPLSIWRRWADDVQGGEMSTRGHFMMEEAPRETAARIQTFLAARVPTSS